MKRALITGITGQDGAYLAEFLLEKGYERIVYDRGGYPYHGQVKALADQMREEGLDF